MRWERPIRAPCFQSIAKLGNCCSHSTIFRRFNSVARMSAHAETSCSPRCSFRAVPSQAAAIRLKKLIGLPSGSRNSIERLPQGISLGCCSQSSRTDRSAHARHRHHQLRTRGSPIYHGWRAIAAMHEARSFPAGDCEDGATEAGKQTERADGAQETIRQTERANDAAVTIRRDADARRADCLRDSRTPENC
ncbi:hypothetical protein M2346_003061 [Sphingobium xanthum]|nr:hypothetical protein [Sphingobium sp. B10D3B]MCW2403041.1 hypothetical protein [Sphingobium sp. B10D7B]MCW2410020.1 hypothetical protein [Sphingobium xanthum]